MIYSKEAYQSLISLALRQGYRFASFLDEPKAGRHIYLRHDVDYSLKVALELARINSALGIRGTFCLLLRSSIYNLLSHNGLNRTREIYALGQYLAFHYALPPIIPEKDEEFADLIRADFNIVQQQLPELQPVFTWHNGGRLAQDGRGLRVQVPGLVNAYSARFVKDIPYYSDTNMRYSVSEFAEIISRRNHPVIHLLFHPLNWIAGGRNMIEVLATTWKHVIREREEEVLENREYGRYFPQGMPAEILDRMSSSIVGASLRSP